MPIRGHTDEEWNVFQFNKDKSQYVAGLRHLMDDKKYMSHSILDEQEQNFVLQARREIIGEINSAKFFSISNVQ